MLTLHLKKIWFDKIKSGEKTHEYREVKPYWTNRIKKEYDFLNCDIDYLKELPLYPQGCITFVCGYPNKNDKTKRLSARIKSISIINGKNTDLKTDKEVFDIEFKLIKDVNNDR